MSIFETQKTPYQFQESEPSKVQSVQHFGEATFGAGESSIIKIDSEGAKFGGRSLTDAQAYIKTDGTYKFKDASGNVLIDSLGASGNFINVINANLDTTTKKVLKDFTFGSADYSGAFKTGDITWNASTGAITGGSGSVYNKSGLIFANAGVATITLDGVTGNATFAGTLAAASGTIGTVTGGTLQTATSGYRIKVNGSTNKIELLNGASVLASMYTDASSNMNIQASNDIRFIIGSTTKWFIDDTGFYPNTDKTGALGSSSKEWSNVYSQNYRSGSSTGATQTWDFDAGESHRFVFVSGLFISHTKL